MMAPSPKILWTRASYDSVLFSNNALEVINDPLLHVHYKDPVTPKEYEGVEVLCITSQHAVVSLVHCPDSSISILSVGTMTGQKLRELGFKNIRTFENVQDLAHHIVQNRSSYAQSILYPRGHDTRLDLKAFLKSYGIMLREKIVYMASPSPSFGAETKDALRQGTLKAAFLFSPRSARIFRQHTEALNVENALKGVHAFCLSSAIAEEIQSLSWKMISVSPKPNLESLIDLFRHENITHFD